MSKKGKDESTSTRNFHACHPIMRKGGPHEKSKSAKRAKAKRETRQKVSDALSRLYILRLVTIF